MFDSIKKYMLLSLFVLIVPVVCAADCPQADLSGDCYVGLEDLLIFAQQWLTDPNCIANPDTCADFIEDGRVDIHDFTILSYEWQKSVTPVLINEFLASNNSDDPPDLDAGEILDFEGDDSDWIELFNITDQSVDLSGWTLVDKNGRWQFPDGVTIGPKEFMLLFASDKTPGDNPDDYPYFDSNGYYHTFHTGFKLTTDGEYLALINRQGQIMHVYDDYEIDTDEYGYPPQETNISYGMLEGQKRYFWLPTPGRPNSEGFRGFVGAVETTYKRGFYEEGFTVPVHLTCETNGAQIRYTTDGSAPTDSNGDVYDPEEGILIDSTTCLRAAGFLIGYKPGPVETHTYMFIDDVIKQEDNEKPGPGWPGNDEVNGQDMNYGMDPEITEAEEYEELMDDALLAIPTLSMTIDLPYLFDKNTGIYVNAHRDGSAWERPGSIELLNPDGAKGFQVNAGIRIRGGFSRSSSNPKHSFRLFFRSEYGAGKLDYPLFGDEGVKSFDKIDLRTAQNYSWSFRGAGGMESNSKNTFCREVFSRDAQGEMGRPYTRSRYYHLYINGHYWGLYQTQERPEARYAESYMGGSKDDYDVLKVEAGSYTINATDGNEDAYKRLHAAAVEGFEDDEAYYKVQGLNPDGTRNPAYEKMLDIDNLIDYMAIIYYTGNYDAPLSNFLGNRRPNNYYALYDRKDPAGWMFFAHDAEHSLFMGWNRTGPWTHDNLWEYRYFNPQWLHQQLCAHPEYRLRFADRIHNYFFHGGLLTPEVSTERFLNRAQQVELAIIAESARWGDSKREKPRTKNEDWLPEIDRTVNWYFPYRTDEVLWQFIADGWYPETKAPSYFIGVDSRHGGPIQIPATLNIDNPNITGTIYYTTDGSDPRTVIDDMSVSVTGTSGTDSSGDIHITDEGDDEEPVYNIIWVTDSIADEKFTDYLEDNGYNVTRYLYTLRGNLSEYELAQLNAADLIIISAATSDTAYDMPLAWNSITTPIIQMNSLLTLNSRWNWLDTQIYALEDPVDLWTPVPEHDLFYNVSLTGGDMVNVVNGETVFPATSDAGNGTLLGNRVTRSSNEDPEAYVWAAMWDTGVEFYPGANQTAGGARMFLAAGEITDPDDTFNLTSSGERIFLNAVELMIAYEEAYVNHAPWVFAWWDRVVMWPNDRIRLYAWAWDDGYEEPLTYKWSVLEGPTLDVTFTNSDEILDPNAIFTDPGIYQLQIEAFDGEKTGSDTVQVRVTEPGQTIVLDKTTRVKARVLDDNGQWSALNDATFMVGSIKESLRISEILYNPAGDPNVEFIEVTNIGSETIDLYWAAFTDGIQFTFPDEQLDPGDYAVIVRDLQKHKNYFGNDNHVIGVYEGNLSNAGEKITLVDPLGEVIQSFEYRDGWHDLTDGDGFSLTMIDPAATDPNDWTDKASWRPSSYAGGSPGYANEPEIPAPGAIVINEVLAHSHDEAADWIELHNTTSQSIDIGGWFLSDSNADDPNRMKYRIPSGTMIPARGFRVFLQNLHFGNPASTGTNIPFALSENGEAVYLRSRLDSDDRFTGYFTKQSFGASETNIPFGRHVNSDGSDDFIAQKDDGTQGYSNDYPKVGPIVISEIMYDPTMGKYLDNDEFEYIELLNISSQTVELQSYDNELDGYLPWKFTDGVNFVFPPDTSMEAGERIVLVRNLAAFEDRYSLPDGTQIFQWDSGRLNNDGEDIVLSRQGDQVDGTRYYIRMESVKYNDALPWPAMVNDQPDDFDTPGQSIHLSTPAISSKNYGNDPANWKIALPSPGR